MTPAEREHVLQEMDQSRESLLRAVDGLTPAQLEYREGPDRWSVAENLEHIAVAEFGMMRWLEGALNDATKPPHAGDWAGKDAELRRIMADSRGTKLVAPETIRPTGRWAVAELVPKFESTRQRTRAFVVASNDDLRCRSLPHPKFGALDCYQWLCLIAHHCHRHAGQIENLKSSANFPR
ncbi:MAG TPA: DinB family protein [Candidatus Acidoferrales bacterium]